MPDSALTVEQILMMLGENPTRIATLTTGLTPVQLLAKPHPDEWSANYVLAHLRSCADMWGNCIKMILTQDKPILRAINPRTWIDSTDYPELEFHSSLRAFVRQRTGLLKVLEPLKPQDWSRTATITGAGKPLIRTVHFYAQWMATHERPHVKQIARIANTLHT